MTDFQALILLLSFGGFAVALVWIAISEIAFRSLDLIDRLRGRC